MATIPDPKKQAWIGLLKGPFNGDIYQAQSIDLETNTGRLMLSDRLIIGTDSTDVSFGIPTAGVLTNMGSGSFIWVATTTNILVSSGWTNFTFAVDTTSNTPAGGNDMLTYYSSALNLRMLVSTSANIAMLTYGGTWNATWGTGILSGLSGTYPNSSEHPLAYLSNIVIIPDGPYVHTIDNNDIGVYQRLIFNSKYVFNLAYAGSDVVWFGFRSALGQTLTQGVDFFSGGIAYWDGGNEVMNESFFLDHAPMTGFLVNNIPFFVLQNGIIVEYNSSGFSEVQAFPCYEEGLTLPYGTTGQNSCTVINDLAYINISAPPGSRRMKSGVWIFNTTTKNLYPRYSYGQYKVGGTDQDFGQSFTVGAGVIIPTHESHKFVVGGSIYTTYPGTTKNVLCTISPNTVNRGYFTTPLIASSNIEDNWYNVWTRYPEFRTSGSLINAKYRVGDPLLNSSYLPIDLTITWTGANTFTAVLPTGIVVGNEVEIKAGDNAGCLFHIFTLSATPNGSSTITVTIDENAPVTSAKAALARFDNWVKIVNNNPLTQSSSGGNNTVHMTTAGAALAGGPYVEFKIELRGVLTSVDQIRSDSLPSIEANL